MRSFHQDTLGTNIGKVEKEGVSSVCRRWAAARGSRGWGWRCAKRLCWGCRLYAKTIINLPGQPRDKHREKHPTQRMRFFAGAGTAPGERGVGAENAFFAQPFYTKHHHFAKTGSGQTQGKLKNETVLCRLSALAWILRRSGDRYWRRSWLGRAARMFRQRSCCCRLRP